MGYPKTGFLLGSSFNSMTIWLVLSDEQMSKRWPVSLLNDEQMSNWVGVKHLPAMGGRVIIVPP